jgi:biotin transport system substrate-specific component
MQAGIRQQVLIDVLVPQTLFGMDSKVGAYVRDAVLILGFAILLSLCAQIAIRIPFTIVPITGQTFGVLLAGGALGSRKGVLSMIVYTAIGMFLLPVFAPTSGAINESLGESGVLHFILPWSGNENWQLWSMASGGYIVGFIVAAYIIGKFAERGWDRKANIILAFFLGNVIIYAFGLPWLAINLSVGLSKTLEWGLWPFIAGDAVKLVLAAMALPGAWALVDRVKNR